MNQDQRIGAALEEELNEVIAGTNTLTVPGTDDLFSGLEGSQLDSFVGDDGVSFLGAGVTASIDNPESDRYLQYHSKDNDEHVPEHLKGIKYPVDDDMSATLTIDEARNGMFVIDRDWLTNHEAREHEHRLTLHGEDEDGGVADTPLLDLKARPFPNELLDPRSKENDGVRRALGVFARVEFKKKHWSVTLSAAC